MKYLEMKILIIHLMKILKYGTANVNFDGLLDGMLLGKEYVTVTESAVIVVDGEENMSKVQFLIRVL